MSSFFTLPASQRKRKRTDDAAPRKTKRRADRGDRDDDRPSRKPSKAERPRERPRQRDESISGSDSEQDIIRPGDDDHDDDFSDSEATSEEGEDAADRRVRLAQRYLDNIRQEVDEAGFDAEDLDRDIIAQRLKADADEAKGRQFRLIAHTLDTGRAHHTPFRVDSQATTGVAVCPPYAYTVSKDKTLVKWQLQPPTDAAGQPSRRRKPKQLAYVKGVKIRALAPQQHGHTGPILCVAASPDGQYVATGGADKKLIVWRAEDLRPLKTFTIHRDGVTALAFAPRSSTNSGFGQQLFSASMDRSLKTYSLAGDDSIAYVETLFGHQDHILGVSAMAVDLCVTVGARDRNAIVWKVVEESLTKFLGSSGRSETYQTGTLDCVAALPPAHFVTGSDAGALSLWSIHRKKAVFTVQTAHGVDEPPPLEEVTSEADPKVIAELKKSDGRRPIPRAITALAAIPGTDVILSGSWEGWIRLWKLADDKRSLLSLGSIGQPRQVAAAATSSLDDAPNGHTEPSGQDTLPNGDTHEPGDTLVTLPNDTTASQAPIRGVINSLAVFERRRQIVSEFGGTKDGECQGVCVVVGTGKSPRLGNFIKIPGGKNGAMVVEVPLKV